MKVKHAHRNHVIYLAQRGSSGKRAWAYHRRSADKGQEKSGVINKGCAELVALNNALIKTAPGDTVVVVTSNSYVTNGICKNLYEWKKRRWLTKQGTPIVDKIDWLLLDHFLSDRNIIPVLAKVQDGNRDYWAAINAAHSAL